MITDERLAGENRRGTRGSKAVKVVEVCARLVCIVCRVCCLEIYDVCYNVKPLSNNTVLLKADN